MQKGIKRFYNWLRGSGEIKAEANEGRCITCEHYIQDEVRACSNYQHYNTDNICVKYENSLRTNEALRKQIKILENNIDKLSSDYLREQNMNFMIDDLRRQVKELKIENTKARNYIKLYSMSLYEAIYGRDIINGFNMDG